MISNALRTALIEQRARGVRQYVLARQLNVHPSLLSHLLNGSIPIHQGDMRVLRLAALLGIPAEQAFEDVA